MMIRHYLIAVTFSLTTLSGCSSVSTLPQNSEVTRAEALIQKGQNKQAATLYKQLAEVKSTQQNYYRLLAADALIRANDIKQANLYISMIDVRTFDDSQLNHFKLLQAQIELSQGHIQQALNQLKVVQVEPLNRQTKIAYYQSLSFAYFLSDDPVQSTQALINVESFISSPKVMNKYHEKILTTLNVLSAEDLQLKQPLDNEILQGWMILAQVFKFDEMNLDNHLTQWRKLYPQHPANSDFLMTYVKKYRNSLTKSGIIAVFLPASGAYAAPAVVIKKGFMQAYALAKKNGTTNNEIRFYDTEKNNPVKLYQQAIKEGAKLVVGPLDKKDIKTLVDSTKLTIPVLALNHIEGLNQKNLYQFALSPIDDAEQITLKAHRDGHHNALFLVPKTEQGKRFANYFTDSWQKLGDKTVSVQFYNDDKTDFSNLTQKILQHNNSDDLVENNIDTLIINAYPKSASLVYPSLQDSQTTVDLPIYATSQIYLGDVDANRDKALEDITFCDVPWMFEQVYTGNLSKSALHKNWENLSPNYLRLLPMGIDAYALITQLSHLKEKPYSGATGKLRLDEGNRITRELFCAKFVNGIPKMLDFASENQTSESLSAVKSPVSSMIMPEKNKSESPKIDEIINSQSSVGIDDGFIQ